MSNQFSRDDLKEIVIKYGDFLFRTCFIMVNNKYDAEDIVQETLIKLRYQRLLISVTYRYGTMLRRICRRGNKPLLFLVPYQPLRIEACGFFHNRVDALTHEANVAGKSVMIVYIEHQPRNSRS